MRFSTLLTAGLVPLSLAACATAPDASTASYTDVEKLWAQTLEIDTPSVQTVSIDGTDHICKRARSKGTELVTVVCGTPRQWRARERGQLPRQFRGAPIQGAVGH